MEKPINVDIIKKAVGIPQNIFTGYGSKKTISVVSGLSLPFTYLSEIKEQVEAKYGERMMNRKVGAVLKELDFESGGMSVVQEKPIKKNINRLERLRGLRKGVN